MIESTPISVLQGVGPRIEKLFRKLDISTVGDLLQHYPVDYDNFTEEILPETARSGQSGWLSGEFINVTSRKSRNRRGLVITEGKFSTNNGDLDIIWFNRFPIKNLPLHKQVLITGTIEGDFKKQMINPFWEISSNNTRFAGRLLPRYPLTAGLSQTVIRACIDQVINKVKFTDWLPESVVEEHGMVDLNSAYKLIHAPKNLKEVDKAKERLAFNEIFLLQAAEYLRRVGRRNTKSFVVNTDKLFKDKFIASLPFNLTDEQFNVVKEIENDLSVGHPMNRLLQGEVGSGKTAVAAVATAMVINAGKQVLYIVPTEVLATQQYQTLIKFFKTFDYNLAILTRGEQQDTLGSKNKKNIIEAINNDHINVVVGTHAILSDLVEIPNLGLVIVDEQHRFGVEQRLTAQKKNQLTPHVLSMSATPIPRTLQMAFAGDVDVSNLTQIPSGKRNVTTILLKPNQRALVESRLQEHLKKGEQAYVVCPLIDPSDALAVKAAATEYERLSKGPLKKYRVGFLHGRLSQIEKQTALQKFRAHELDVLVSTSVIEVGIDVPNATTIIIEGAERFGLAQLHQLRGRVGRGGQSGYCLLFTEAPSDVAWHRLQQFSETSDGFKLAELDLSLRGPGEWFGVRQSGYPDFKIASLHDYDLLKKAGLSAKKIIDHDLSLKKFPLLLQRIGKITKIAGQA